jgi:hypothetical protein
MRASCVDFRPVQAISQAGVVRHAITICKQWRGCELYSLPLPRVIAARAEHMTDVANKMLHSRVTAVQIEHMIVANIDDQCVYSSLSIVLLINTSTSLAMLTLALTWQQHN